ncbi:BTB/POZ domain-containing protein At3g56230-like [Zingiber officinale]|uniref:BTB/POZ domain-containing protein At3g56230-like n=1 Tax=Zingiber officinale TaxID=94328 RepID=UPI001C4AC2C2|nr:BTB/POZ domain-containing protein At3g56230-like [Zingiber officinale]XP_042413894.1 BTB/POZ domain-containing protein At3g56230-like [Zingiber officinale]
MDCCICSPTVSVYRPPRNSICASCYDGARSMIAFLNELDGGGSKCLPAKGILHGFEKMKEMQQREEEMKEKVGFLDGLVALREGMHADILVKAGDGRPIPAHRAVLASKSEIFKTMLLADDCKAAPAGDTISLPELTQHELQSLLEFLYSGQLPQPEQEASSTVRSLLVAADKYDIPFLRQRCEQRILTDLRAANALDALDVAQRCSDGMLKERAMRVVVDKAEEVVFSEGFEEFARRNAELCVEITRALVSNKMTVTNKAEHDGGCEMH